MPVKPTKAMVLAAGLGLRMRPLTERMPKPLVEVAGRPLLDHVLDKLGEAGVTPVDTGTPWAELVESGEPVVSTTHCAR